MSDELIAKEGGLMSSAPDQFLNLLSFKDFLFDNLSAAIFVVDKDLKVQKVNNAYKALFHKEERDVLNTLCGNSIGCAFAVEEDKPCGQTSECGQCSLRSCLIRCFSEADKVQSTYISRKFYVDGKAFFKYFRIKVKMVKFHEEVMAIIMVDDVTELEEQKKQIEDLANRDYLTRLFNRRYLFECGEKIFQNARRGSFNLAVVMMDIDFFKKINDTHGHDAGDFLLASVADILRSNLRQADIIARFGGEEFCLLLNVSKPGDAFSVVEKIRQMIERQKFFFGNKHIPVTISSGITCILEESLESMIKKSDIMLYKAKESGRNKVMVYITEDERMPL